MRGRPPPASELYDRVLVDPPCSGLGTLASRPDLRWRVSPERIDGLVAEQRRILDAAAVAVRPGGLLVYSTCTLSPAENELQLERFLDVHSEFEPAELRSDLAAWQDPAMVGQLLVLPHRHRSDGFFIGRLRRHGGGASDRHGGGASDRHNARAPDRHGGTARNGHPSGGR
jgi:16S rRNA (cytosine967-C5)-methyltransferase